MTNFSKINDRALEIQALFAKMETKKYGRNWTREEIAQGFVGDVGDLMKLVLAQSGVRDIENANEKIAHELSDCLWSILVLADKYEVDIEKSFLKTMDQLETKIAQKIDE